MRQQSFIDYEYRAAAKKQERGIPRYNVRDYIENRSLSYTQWNCQYHIVLILKYKKKVMYGKVRADILRLSENSAITRRWKS